MIKKPAFFIIGAPKCGTTSLYSWLKDHPDIFMPDKKEPHYFAQHLSDRYCRVRTEAEYLDLFSSASEKQICGEASVLYGFYPQSIKNILAFNRDAKIIYMVRNPVGMAQSYHQQLINNLEENVTDFEKAWNLQGRRQKGKKIPRTATDPDLLNYKEKCALGSHLKNIQATVPKGQLSIIRLEDMAKNPKETYQGILKFIGVGNDNRQDFQKENEAFSTRFKFLKYFFSKQILLKKFVKKIIPVNIINSLNTVKKQKTMLSDSFEKKLYHELKNEISLLESQLK